MRWLGLIIFLLFVIVTPLMAQEAYKAEDADETKPQSQPLKEQDRPENKTKTETDYQLEGIVVKERRIKNIEKSITVKGGTSTEITAQDIEERSDKVLKDVLYQVPGIQISTQRKGTTQFYMRGYDMSKVAMLVDDIPLIESYTGSMDIDNIGLLDISEIVVSRGTTSALYGTRGGVGSINLVRKKPVKMYTDVSAEYGEHDNIVTSVAHGAPVGNFYYQLSALYDKSGGYEISEKLDRKEREKWLKKLSRYDLYGFTRNDIYSHPGSSAAVYYLDETGIWKHTQHEKYKLNGKFGYHITPDLDMGLSLFYNQTEKENSSYFTDMRSMYTYNSYTQDKDWRLPDTTYVLRNMSSRWPEYNDYAVSPYVIYEKGRFGIKANAYFYENSNKFMAYDDPLERILAYNRDVDTMTWSIWTSRTYGFNLYPSCKLSSWNRLNFALSYYVSSHKEEDQAYNRAATKTIENYGTGKYTTLDIEAAYLTLAVEDEMRLMDNMDLTLGVSYDAQDLNHFRKKLGINGSTEMIDQYEAEDDSMLWGTRDSLNPVVGILYEPVKDFLKLKASASRKTAFPSLQAYSKTVSPYQTSSDLGSKDVNIKPEKMLNGNLGFEFSFFNKKLTWGADYFYSKYDDKITKIYITKIDDYIFRNIDSAVIHGAETTMTLNFTNVFDMADISFSSTYTYIHSRNQADVDDSFVNKGDKFERLPEHKFTFDFRTYFKTDTSLMIFGNLEFNQIQYVMSSIPKTTDDFSTSYYNALELHNPLKIDIKLSQKIFKNYEVYLMCKNILDDYNADPFDPGPGRIWYAGVKASF
ncbi:MAG TPA: TonB-dependent receptor plug domain-containing protein [Smithella sp.]|nr:TonB-dependent receptor plug domain-containing protein [Smithella sp.]